MDTMTTYTAAITYLSLGFVLPILAKQIAQLIAGERPKTLTDPRQMLSIFYISQALKLTAFTVLCLISVIICQADSVFVILGTGCNILFYLAYNNFQTHEQLPKYSN